MEGVAGCSFVVGFGVRLMPSSLQVIQRTVDSDTLKHPQRIKASYEA